eukprot:m.137111 g.137111  ORF g.137111 m.137111 type:complete len:142 (+) comp22662_c1_seq1:2560-2985(+)
MPVDREILYAPYEDVRDDKSETTWAQFIYDNKDVVVGGVGSDYAELIAKCSPDERWYAFVRIETGDELSKRAKFVFLTWVGESVSAMKKAKMSTDKADIKMVVRDYAKEILADELSEVQYAEILSQVQAVGGANYGTGVRD